MKIQLEGSDIEEVEKFVYFGVIVVLIGGGGEDINVWMGKV